MTSAAARPASLSADRAWPPRAPIPIACGAIDIAGQLEQDAELRLQPDGKRGVIALELSTGRGHLFAATLLVDGDPHALQDAQALTRLLRRGAAVRVRAHGCLPRNDHGHAVLQLLDVESVAPVKEEA